MIGRVINISKTVPKWAQVWEIEGRVRGFFEGPPLPAEALQKFLSSAAPDAGETAGGLLMAFSKGLQTPGDLYAWTTTWSPSYIFPLVLTGPPHDPTSLKGHTAWVISESDPQLAAIRTSFRQLHREEPLDFLLCLSPFVRGGQLVVPITLLADPKALAAWYARESLRWAMPFLPAPIEGVT